MSGLKHDQGKPNWFLLPLQPVEEAVKVLTIANESGKYPEYNWQQVDPKKYWSACFRHLTHYQGGEQYDTETGKSHLAHALVNLIFLLWFELVRGIYLWRSADEVPIQVNEPTREPIKRKPFVLDEHFDPVDDTPALWNICAPDTSFWDRLYLCRRRSNKTDSST